MTSNSAVASQSTPTGIAFGEYSLPLEVAANIARFLTDKELSQLELAARCFVDVAVVAWKEREPLTGRYCLNWSSLNGTVNWNLLQEKIAERKQQLQQKPANNKVDQKNVPVEKKFYVDHFFLRSIGQLLSESFEKFSNLFCLLKASKNKSHDVTWTHDGIRRWDLEQWHQLKDAFPLFNQQQLKLYESLPLKLPVLKRFLESAAGFLQKSKGQSKEWVKALKVIQNSLQPDKYSGDALLSAFCDLLLIESKKESDPDEDEFDVMGKHLKSALRLGATNALLFPWSLYRFDLCGDTEPQITSLTLKYPDLRTLHQVISINKINYLMTDSDMSIFDSYYKKFFLCPPVALTAFDDFITKQGGVTAEAFKDMLKIYLRTAMARSSSTIIEPEEAELDEASEDAELSEPEEAELDEDEDIELNEPEEAALDGGEIPDRIRRLLIPQAPLLTEQPLFNQEQMIRLIEVTLPNISEGIDECIVFESREGFNQFLKMKGWNLDQFEASGGKIKKRPPRALPSIAPPEPGRNTVEFHYSAPPSSIQLNFLETDPQQIRALLEDDPTLTDLLNMDPSLEERLMLLCRKNSGKCSPPSCVGR